MFLESGYALTQENKSRKTAGTVTEALKTVMDQLWDQKKGVGQLKQLFILRIMTLNWFKQDFPDLSSIVEEFVLNRIEGVCGLLCQIPSEYHIIGKKWLVSCSLFSKTKESNSNSLQGIYEYLQKSGIIVVNDTKVQFHP